MDIKFSLILKRLLKLNKKITPNFAEWGYFFNFLTF